MTQLVINIYGSEVRLMEIFQENYTHLGVRDPNINGLVITVRVSQEHAAHFADTVRGWVDITTVAIKEEE